MRGKQASLVSLSLLHPHHPAPHTKLQTTSPLPSVCWTPAMLVFPRFLENAKLLYTSPPDTLCLTDFCSPSISQFKHHFLGEAFPELPDKVQWPSSSLLSLLPLAFSFLVSIAMTILVVKKKSAQCLSPHRLDTPESKHSIKSMTPDPVVCNLAPVHG